MHMIDVMKKLQEIAEAGYDNEDIQRGIDAAGKHVVEKNVEPIIEGDIPPGLKAYQDKKKGKTESVEEVEEEAVEEDADDSVEEGLRVDAKPKTKTKPYMPIILQADDNEEDADDGVEEVHEDEAVEETVEINVNELAELMQLAGYTDYAEKIEEYANEPEEKYMDAEEQLIGLSGGLNGPKKAYAAAAGGDNPMRQEPQAVREGSFDSFYAKYDKFVKELSQED
jgi:hypothetical protein